MNKGKTIFSQIMSLIPERDFKTCVDRYKGNYRARNFSCKDQFLVMKRLPYLNYTGKDGTWNFTLNGLSNTFTSNLFTELPRMPYISKSGLPYAHTCF